MSQRVSVATHQGFELQGIDTVECMNPFVMEVAMDCCLRSWFCTRCAWLALRVRQCLLVDGRRDHRPSEKAEANTHVKLAVMKTTVMLEGISATIPTPFMAAEPLFRSAATRTVETTEQKNERWMEGDCHSKLKIENLGPRRARSGRSRCLEDLRKFLECCRRSEAPPAAQR